MAATAARSNPRESAGRSRRALGLTLSLLLAAATALLAAATAQAGGGNTWAGTWSTDFNTMTLTGDSQGFSGNYDWDEGRIRATLTNAAKRLYVGTWDEVPSRTGPSDAGDIEFTLAGDGKSFTGRWCYEGGTSWANWNGTCTAGPCLNNSVTSVPPPPPPSPPKKKKAKGLGIDYSMPSRFGKRGKRGLIKYPTKKQIKPRNWRVDFVVRRKDGKPCRQSDILVANAGNARFYRGGRNPCRFYGLFAKEGAYNLKVTLKTGKGKKLRKHKASRKIVVQDWLIVGLGDSNGSGEGTPDIPKPSLRKPAKWQEVLCDRSANSHQAQTARTVERRDKRTSVTFVHLSCSGASIAKGLLGKYGGINKGRIHPPQVSAMKSLAQGREIDAVIISIGVNDLGFAALVKECLGFPNCPVRAFPHFTSETTLHQVMQARLASLPRLYDRLSRALKKQKIPARRVFITEYFDSTKDENGQTCDPLISTTATHFDRAEAQWASDSVLTPLNQAVRAAAQKHGWRLVVGSEQGFRTHGYCSPDPWIVGITESLARQGDGNGTLHSTVRGNTFQAGLVYGQMRLEFYKDGRTRVPAR